MESEQKRSGNNGRRRLDWESHHLAIEQCVLESIKNDKRFPTYKELEIATGLRSEAIAAHSKELDLKDLRTRSRLLGAPILERQAMRAFATGDHNEAKTFVKLNYDWKEQSEINSTLTVQTDEQRRARIAEEQAEVEREMLLLSGRAVDAEFTEISTLVETQNGEFEA